MLNDIANRILRVQEQLGATAGNDPRQDKYLTGVIAGYMDLLKVEFEDVAEANSD